MPDREKVIADLRKYINYPEPLSVIVKKAIELLKEQEPDQSKYEHHIDHTDCVWYKPEEGNECPVTCSQYRDGWNDAMDYIFKDGRGYRPYVRG